jgi:hypothetical protein
LATDWWNMDQASQSCRSELPRSISYVRHASTIQRKCKKRILRTAPRDQCRVVGAASPFEEQEHLGSEQFRCDTLETCFKPNAAFSYLIAWSEQEQAACYVSIDRANQKGEAAFNIYHNAMDMDERCGAIMGLGGRWCRCKAECPDLKDLDWSSRDRGPDRCHDLLFYVIDPEDATNRWAEL